MLVCRTVLVNNFAGPDYFDEVCLEEPDSYSGDRDPGGGISRPSSGGIWRGPAANFDMDPGGGTVSVPSAAPPAQPPPANLNLGWNSGAYSVEQLPPDWEGVISFDIPDIQGSPPTGVAIGLAPVSALPRNGVRSGYAQLRYGLVFSAPDVRVIYEWRVVKTVNYGLLRSGTGTDVVNAVVGNGRIVWYCNDHAVFTGAFSMPEPFVLDATLYSVNDSVDNPKFTAGLPDSVTYEDTLSIVGPMPVVLMGQDEYGELAVEGPALSLKMAEAQYGELVIEGPTPEVTALMVDEAVGPGATGMAVLAIAGPRPDVRMSDQHHAELVIEGPRLIFAAAATEPDLQMDYMIMALSMGWPGASIAVDDLGELVIEGPRPLLAVAEGDHAELVIEGPHPAMLAYSGELTPLVRVMEYVLCLAQQPHTAYAGVTFIEHVGGTATLAVAAMVALEQAVEQVTAQDQYDVLATALEAALEQLAVGERVAAAVLRLADGDPVEDGQAWVVNTDSGASTRYDRYGFNSFARVGGRHFGARQDGVYLLEGADDAGRPIRSGVALGTHDFGTQALKHLDAVYAGVSSTGALFIRVGDGANAYTYRARRSDPRMRVQRFDVGRGIRTNYFTFDLTSEADAFELDSVTFHVLATQRRI